MGKTLAAICILFSYAAYAVDLDLKLPDKETILEPIFKESAHPWMVQGVLEFPFYSFYLGAPKVSGVAYLPNFVPRLGPRIIYKDVGAIVTFGLPEPAAEKRRRGDSDHSGITLNSYWRQNAMDLYFQQFKGFYVSSPFTELSFNKPERYPQLPDARVLTVGVNWYYVANPEAYSLKAAFDLTEFQTRSGGSWVYNPFYNHFDISIGQAFVPGVGSDSLKALPNLASARMDTLGVAVGYGYTFIRGKYFATAQGALGPAAQYQRIRRNDGEDTGLGGFAAKMNVNMSTGWNNEDYVGGAKLLLDTLWGRVGDTQVWSSLVNVQFFFGHRF